MIVDAHYHLEEQMETVEALLKQMERHDVQRVALIPKMNEPFHLKPIPKKASGLLPPLLMSRLRFLGLLLYNSTVTSDGKLSTLGTKYDIYHKPDNTYIHHVIQEYPDKFFGWIFINPKTMDSMVEVERWVGKQGWVGVKTHPFWHSYPVDMLDDVAAFCEEKNLPILMHLGGDRESGNYRYLPERHPRLRIIYAHAAVPYFREVWNYAKDKENIFIDLSSLVYTDQGVLSSVIETLGAEKCL
jgi:predicted TIM-barrel fold metal-dependent hydrolase